MTSQTGQLVIKIHILRNISRVKVNQTTKFGQLIEHNMINIFLEKSYRFSGGEDSPNHFIKSENLVYLEINSL